MTPTQFLDRLLVHYSKRHSSDEAETLWQQEMLEIVGTTGPQILAKTYQMIRAEYEERAFPLPATITKFISRAAATVPVEHKLLKSEPDLPPPNLEAIARVQDMVAKMKADFSWHKLPLEKLAPPRDVSRTAFRQMQEENPALHVDHRQALTRRITGERD